MEELFNPTSLTLARKSSAIFVVDRIKYRKILYDRDKSQSRANATLPSTYVGVRKYRVAVVTTR